MKRAIIYARAASCENAEESLTQQESAAVKYANDRGMEIVDIIRETGSDLDFEREGLNRILEAAKKETFDTLIIRDLSRIGRSLEKIIIFMRVFSNGTQRSISFYDSAMPQEEEFV